MKYTFEDMIPFYGYVIGLIIASLFQISIFDALLSSLIVLIIIKLSEYL